MGDKEAGSIYVEVARKALENYVKGEEKFEFPEELPRELKEPGAAFVSLKKRGELRGCIGTILPARENLLEEIISNAVSAGVRDPRFPPVTPEELEEITYNVDVLSEPEEVEDISQLDPQRFGVIVRSGSRSGVLLPSLEGIDTVEQQLSIAEQKAGISEVDPVEIYRFEVKRYY